MRSRHNGGMTENPKRTDPTRAVDEERQVRLAAALRANLRRRKAQLRERAAGAEASPGNAEDERAAKDRPSRT